MRHHVFCDGLQDVSIVSGVVRLDYVHHVPGAPGPDGKPRKEHALRVCMSPEAFVQSYAVLERVMQELASRGLVTRRSVVLTRFHGHMRALGFRPGWGGVWGDYRQCMPAQRVRSSR